MEFYVLEDLRVRRRCAVWNSVSKNVSHETATVKEFGNGMCREG
jgi:hypothetical protein